MVIVIVAVLLIVSSILILVMRNRLKKESATFDDEISHALICPTNNSYELSKSKAISESSQRFDDIETALAGMYDNTYISGADEERFTNHFSNVFSMTTFLFS